MRVFRKESQDRLSTREAHPATVPIVHTTVRPKLAMCNIFLYPQRLEEFAREYGFSGIDWSFDALTLPQTPAEESTWAKELSHLDSIEIRYHCPFYRIDLGHDDPLEARAAEAVFHRIIRLVSKVHGRYLTIHVGLGHDYAESLSWERTIDNLRRLVQRGADYGVKVCLENLVSGWTSRPHLYEKLIRRTGAGVTFDIGHAHACEPVNSHQYSIEDFVIPHADRVFNAHIYHTEVPGRGHAPPDCLEDIEDRLSVLQNTGCNWWTLEVREVEGLLQTKRIVEDYLIRAQDQAKPLSHSRAVDLASHR
jgi:sugar phosphate isomerase/epimerase